MVRDACKQYGYEVSPKIEEEFKYHKTHNDGVFSAYTKDCLLYTSYQRTHGWRYIHRWRMARYHRYTRNIRRMSLVFP